MTILVSQVDLSTLSHHTIAEVLPKEQSLQLPTLCIFDLNQQLLTTQANNIGERISVNIDDNISDSNVELIVFADITIKQLLTVLSKSQITINTLNAINERNDLTSYRFSVSCSNLEHSKNDIAAYAIEENIEIALIKQAPRLDHPGVLVMDMDSTTIKIECIDEIAAQAGVGPQVAEVTELAMQGKLDFSQSLHQRVATLAGTPETALQRIADTIPLMEGLETLVSELKSHQWKIAIASGGFTFFADHLKEILNLDAAHANVLEIIDGKLSGKILGDVFDAQAKADTLVVLKEQFQISAQQTVAMGDGANDLVMMNAAHLGIAFHAKPIVLKQADCSINHSGLDLMLHWLA